MGLVILWRRIDLFIFGCRASGTFVRWESRGIRRQYFHPVVSFQAHDGQTYEFIGGPGGTRKKQKSSYHVLYPAEKPEKAMTHCFLSYWAAPPMFFILAAGTAVALVNRL